MTHPTAPEIKTLLTKLRVMAADCFFHVSDEDRAVIRQAADIIAALSRPQVAQPDAVAERLCRAIDGLLQCPEIADAAPEDKDEETHAAEREARNARDAFRTYAATLAAGGK